MTFRKVCDEANGNILAIMNLYEFTFEKVFIDKVLNCREKRTCTTKRQSERNLEKLLKIQMRIFAQKKN